MEYYVLRQDFNSKTITKYNIFVNGSFHDGVNKLKEEYRENKDRDKLIHSLDKLCKYCFWAKCEYELFCCGWCDWKAKEGHEYYPDFYYYFDKENGDKLVKIDIYYQIKDNIPLIADSLINEWGR